MHLLFSIIYAAHATGTHHKLALDALEHLRCTDSDLWQRLFLQHAKVYLQGSKAPDNEFKDFKNHVLHTRDGYWGGAPEKARSWYQHTVEALSKQDWATAIYCAGVLSHYYTDPLHPFHTGQSEAENNIHRAVEWSISRAYDALADQGAREFPNVPFSVPAGDNWLAVLVCRGADKANASYEKLIAHYDFQRGVVDPPAGLDRVARRIIAELIRYATLSFAVVLDRAITDANVSAPEVPLAAATVAAMAQAPFKMIARRIANTEERRTIERMYDELLATGTVEKTLSEDDRTVRALHAQEVVASRPAPPEASKVFPFKPRDPTTELPRPPVKRTGAKASATSNVVPLRATPSAPKPPPLAAKAQPPPPAAASPAYHLALDADVVDAPTIGPKTAARLYPHGIKTVKDLMRAEPAALAVLLDNRHITPETIASWQDEALLVCTVPGLRGTHAQLLVGAGYRTADAIAAADADKLCADVLTFATSADGQRLLRNGDPPNVEKIKGWLEAAQSVKAA